MKLLVDMNLSPEWAEILRSAGYAAVHWSSVGDARAKDRAITDWAVVNGAVVITNDLDFGAILATSRASYPSVIQLRAQDVTPAVAGAVVLSALRQYEDWLQRGALISVDEHSARARVLPFGA